MVYKYFTTTKIMIKDKFWVHNDIRRANKSHETINIIFKRDTYKYWMKI